MRPCKLHLGRKVSIYAFCGTLAAKVILINCENVFPSGERPVWPDVRRLNIVLSTEIRVWPDGNAAGCYSSSASEPPHRTRRSAF